MMTLYTVEVSGENGSSRKDTYLALRATPTRLSAYRHSEHKSLPPTALAFSPVGVSHTTQTVADTSVSIAHHNTELAYRNLFATFIMQW